MGRLQLEPHHSLSSKKMMQKTSPEVDRKPPETDKLLGQGAYWNVNGLPKSIPKTVLLYYSWPYPIFICPSIIGGLLYSSIANAPGLTFVWVAIPNRVKSIFVLVYLLVYFQKIFFIKFLQNQNSIKIKK